MTAMRKASRSTKELVMNGIQSGTVMAKRNNLLGAILLMGLTLTASATAEAKSPKSPHKVKSGTFTLVTQVTVAGTVLDAGDYEVREKNSPDGPVMEFVHLFDVAYDTEGLPIHDEEVVAKVKVSEVEAAEAPKQTQLILASGSNDAVHVEIRGSAIAYEIASQQTTAQSRSSTSANVGCQPQ